MKKLLQTTPSSHKSLKQLEDNEQLPDNHNSIGSGSGGGGGGGGGGLITGGSATGNTLVGKTIKLPNYNSVTIEDVIAEGGFGIVFLARGSGAHSGNGKYALKRIVVNNERDLKVAENEVDILAKLTRLQNKHLLSLLDHQITKLSPDISEIIFLTPYCKNSLLNLLNKSVMAKAPLTQVQVLRIFSDVVVGVAGVHTLGLIHRDLKIENVLENGSGFVLCDFGSATSKVWDPQKDSIQVITEDLERYTTLAYRSPEMVDLYSGRGPITIKSDLWALGVLLYKTCYLVTPFGDSVLAIQSARKPEFPANTLYSPELQSLISYMLIPDQEQRPDIYQVSEFVHNLLEVANPLPPPSNRVLTVKEINEYFTKNKEQKKITTNTSAAVVPTVLETTVTPRQRPKAGALKAAGDQLVVEEKVAVGVGVGAAAAVGILPPPKSPKADRRNNEETGQPIMPMQAHFPAPQQPEQVTVTNSMQSWNPFETDAFAATSNQEEEEDDPFAKAPFDYFTYHPITSTSHDFHTTGGLVNGKDRARGLNPFLTDDAEDDEHVDNTTTTKSVDGVMNFCFDD